MILPFSVALALLSLSYLSIFRSLAPDEILKYEVTFHFQIIMVQLFTMNFWNMSFTCLPITNEPTLPLRFKPLKGNSYLLTYFWALTFLTLNLSFKIDSCQFITWSSFHLIWHLSDVLWYFVRVLFYHPQINYLIACCLWLILNAGCWFFFFFMGDIWIRI